MYSVVLAINVIRSTEIKSRCTALLEDISAHEEKCTSGTYIYIYYSKEQNKYYTWGSFTDCAEIVEDMHGNSMIALNVYTRSKRCKFCQSLWDAISMVASSSAKSVKIVLLKKFAALRYIYSVKGIPIVDIKFSVMFSAYPCAAVHH